ncbi:MAG: hypothetical protein QW702_07125 [Candidatus Bathyarchaeia archaeon]
MPEKFGEIQKQILKLLALQPDMNAYKIQETLNIPPRNYPSVWNALQKLHEQGFITATEGLSEKRVLIKFWRLSKEGLMYVLTDFELSPLEFKQAIFNYIKDEQAKQTLAIMYEELGDELAQKILRLASTSYFSSEQKMDIGIFSALTQLVALDKESRKKIIKFLERIIPPNHEYHKILSETRRLIDEMEKLGLI